MCLRAHLEARIRANGPLSVAEYMETALTHPAHGYYTTRDPLGVKGDFTTAPEISQVFGELLGAWLADAWMHSGRPEFTWLELGPGRGTLMRDALRATRAVPGFHAAARLRLLEASPVLKATQAATLDGFHHDIQWIEQISNLTNYPLFFLANEFFDALPIRQFTAEGERQVEWAEGGLRFTPPSPVTREESPASLAVMHQLAAHVAAHGGAGLVIDYGYTEGSQGDTLQAVRAHAYADPLENPGEADLTAHVDFRALAEAARAAGARTHGPIPQGLLLGRLGAGPRTEALCRHASAEQAMDIRAGVARLVSPREMGELFQALAVTHPSLIPEGFS